MNDTSHCTDREQNNEKTYFCSDCNRQLDYITASISQDLEEAIFICSGSIIQKIFVYGKYVGGMYGAISFNKYYTKDECEQRACEDNIKDILNSLKEDEYSRFINCHRGLMNAIILSSNMVQRRKDDLLQGKLKQFFPAYGSERKYYCYLHAKERGFVCECGEKLIQVGSSEYSELTGMEDQKFMEKYINGILELRQ